MNNCKHQQWVYKAPYLSDEFYGEELVDPSGYERTYLEISTGRYQCTQCREVFYYTGLWRDYYEKGIDCSGADRIVEYNEILRKE